MAPEPRISVVVPVYDEHDNIGACLRGLWSALSDVPHEILVCYDFDEDTTLLAIAAMTDAPPTLRLVKNTLGRGAANALRAGFAAATGDVVVTTMADLSDPPRDILRMAELMRRENLAVVSGSRYMRGGSQSGGPWLKRTLSRIGGVSLRWIAGLGTSDATSNFRAYSHAFLERVRIQSRSGFQIAIELTVKAHLAGLGIGEVPTTWTDRTAGASRFRLWRWLPQYLRWWLRATWQPMVVLALWIAMSFGAARFVHQHAARMPIWDDLELVPFIGPDYHWTVQEMWSQHNEHRLPLPRRLETALFGATRDVRSMMYAEVALLSGLALATVLVVRRIRGRTLLVDALFPLLWLHTGNAENLLMGFQISLVLPTAFVCALVLLAVRRGRRGFTPGEALAAGLLLVALPLCGGPGLVQAAILSVGLVLAAWYAWRTRAPSLRRGAWVLSVCLLVTAAIAVLYMVDFRFPQRESRAHDPALIGAAAMRTLTLVLGDAGESWWPWSGIGIGLLLAATCALLARAWARLRAERFRVAALGFGMFASIAIALSIGFGRAGAGVESGFAMRYIPLVSPMIVAAMCAWTLYGGRAGRWLVPGAFAVAMLSADVFVNAPAGEEYGCTRADLGREIDRDLHDGMSPGVFVEKWAGRIYPDRRRLYEILEHQASLGIAPFDDASAETRTLYTCLVFNLPPVRIESPLAPVQRMIGCWPILLVPGGCALHFDVPPDVTHLSGAFGMLDAAVARGKAPGVRAIVSAGAVDGGAGDVLFERAIDPVHRIEDRGVQAFDVLLPPDKPHVVLELRVPAEATREARWAYWGDLRFE